MKMTIAQMQARIYLLKDAASTAQDLIGLYDGSEESFNARHTFFVQYVFPLCQLHDASTKSRVKHGEAFAMMEQAEELARKAVIAAYEQAGGKLRPHMALDTWIESVREHKAAVNACIDSIISAYLVEREVAVLIAKAEAETDARLDHMYRVLTAAGIEPQDHLSVTPSDFQFIGDVDTARRAAEVLRAAGYAVEASQMFLGTYFISKRGPVPTLPGDCPECGSKEARAFNGPVVECTACGFQHLAPVDEEKPSLKDMLVKEMNKSQAAKRERSAVESLPEPKPPKIKDAGLMTVADVPLYIKEIAFSKLQAVPHPCYFSLRGTPGMSASTLDSAYSAFEKLRKWCESLGAEVTMIRNSFRTENGLEHAAKVSESRLLIEITDPAARFLEQVLESIHGSHWKISAPKEPYLWRYLKEQGKLPEWRASI